MAPNAIQKSKVSDTTVPHLRWCRSRVEEPPAVGAGAKVPVRHLSD